MKTPNFIVRIPEPCHEDWNKMEPDPKGKFCQACSKSVFDFSTKTDTEIKDILLEYKDQKVCGHFKKSQVNRPLNISVNLNDLPKNISITKVFAVAIFLVFGAFLFSCTDEHGQKVAKIEVVENEPPQQQYTIGMSTLNFIPPPIDSVETISSTLMRDTVVMVSEGSVSGGLSVEEAPVSEEFLFPVAKDSIGYEEPRVVGMMLSYTEADSSYMAKNDTSDLDIAKKNETDASSIKSNEFIIYPNPSNGEFTITYELKKRANVILNIIDMKGVLIRTLVDISNQYDGKYKIPVNLNELPNGIYLVSLLKGDKKLVERVVIEK